MSTASELTALPIRLSLVSVEDYLADELDGPIRHEYVGAVLYAMAAESNAHNIIAGNALGVAARALARPALSAIQLGHENSHPAAEGNAILLPRCLGDLPAESSERRLPGRARDRVRGPVAANAAHR